MFRKNITGTRIFVLFLVLMAIIGLAIFRDYGVHYDEELQINIAVTNYRYMNQGDPALLTFQDRYYGPFFELPLLMLFNGLPSPWMLYGRHLAVFFTFLCGLVCFYFLSKRLLREQKWALLAVVLLVIHPRIFADSFYNSKDIPFLVFFMLGITSLINLISLLHDEDRIRPLISAIILHSFITSAVAATRIPGLILMGISVTLIGVGITVNPARWKRDLCLTVVYVVLTLGLLIVFMPVFWHDPVGEFLNALAQTSRYTQWKDDVLFLGQSFPANNAVWNYLPVWVSITTPYLPLFALIPGIIWMFIYSVHGFIQLIRVKFVFWKDTLTPGNISWMAVIIWFFGPLMGTMIFRAVLYDGWRQMYFIYPAMVVIGVYGLKKTGDWISGKVKQPSIVKAALGLVLLAGILEPVVFMLNNHPYEFIYFNRLAGDPATLRQRFDLDYWGLTYKQAIDYVIAHDTREYFEMSAVGPPALYVEYVLPPEQASRVRFSGMERADYFLTNYRWHPEDYPYPKYYSINVSGMEIMTVYCLKEPCGG